MFPFSRNRSPQLEDDIGITMTLNVEEDPQTSQTDPRDISDAAWMEMEVAMAADTRQTQAESDIRRDEIIYGQMWTGEARQLLVARRVKELEDLDRLVEGYIELDRLRLEVRESDRQIATERHRELVDTVERGNVVAKVVDFAMAHPFLTGFIGTGILRNIAKRNR